MRWLFSTMPTAMVIDDHDMSDDWNISRTWAEEMERKDWWQKRLIAGFSTYWLYQHMGNLSPSELSEDRTWNEVRENREDATEVLMDYANRAHNNRDGISWSFYRDLCRTRVIVMDNRGGRVLEKDRRSIFDDEERDWVWDKAKGILTTSSSALRTHSSSRDSFHWLEAWNEKVVEGEAWGSLGVEARREDAPRRRLRPLVGVRLLIRQDDRVPPPRGQGRMGRAARLHRRLLGRRSPRLSRRGCLSQVGRRRERRLPSGLLTVPQPSGCQRAACHPPRNHQTRPSPHPGLAKSAGVPDPDLRWRFTDGPFFDNQVATIHIEGRKAEIKLEKTKPGETEEESLETTYERRLA